MKFNHKAMLGKSSLLVSAALLSLSACTAGFEDINNPKHLASAQQLAVDNYNVGSYMAQLQDQAFPEQENAYQMGEDLIGNYLGRYLTYTVPSWNGKSFATFNAPDGWARWPFRQVTPKVLGTFNDIKRLASQNGANYEEDLNYNWALVLRAYALLKLTDIYGPLPLGFDERNPKLYNSQEQIYKTLLADLDQAIGYLKGNNVGKLNVAEDKIYKGDFSKWLKFAASLKLRMALRIRFVEPALAQKAAQEAVAVGVLEDSGDNAERPYIPRGLYKTSVEWGDSRMCADIDSYMNGYADPRLSKYFSPVKDEDALAGRPYIGLPAGSNVGNKDIAVEIYSAVLAPKESKTPWLTAAEMWFCRAEAALAGWSGMGGTAKELYEKGVKASFAQWGVNGADAYLQSTAQPATYADVEGRGGQIPAASTISPKWDDTARNEVKLERLITQKWIALFPNGQEAWSDIRRTGYPKVFDVPVKNGYTLRVPNRIPFDTEEKVNNAEGYASGVALLGGSDDYATTMWWQKK